MRTVDFPEANCRDNNIPSHKDRNMNITCWHIGFWDCIKLVFTRRLWHFQLTMTESPQPTVLKLDDPFEPVISNNNSDYEANTKEKGSPRKENSACN